MEFEGKYNPKSPAVKRLMREACELHEPTDQYYARPLEDNLFEWHFTVEGPSGTEFEGGLYHGRILFPTEYPMKPPNIILLTPNGRFEINKKICLSISGHHPETWQPSWSIRTALLALIAFMPTPGNGTIGALDYSAEERKKLAHESHSWECCFCGKMSDQLNKVGVSNITVAESDLIKNLVFKEEKKEEDNEGEEPPAEMAEIGDKKVADDEDEEVAELSVSSVYEGESLSTNNELPQQPQVIESTSVLSQCYKDSFFNFLIGIILAAIGFLIYRRIFLVQ